MKVFAPLSALVLLLICSSSYGEEQAILSVKPERCIALHKGQTCYQTVKFNWQLPNNDEYCLFETSKPEPLVCWIGTEEVIYTTPFVSTVSLEYQLRHKLSEKVLANTRITVAWVYKSNRKGNSAWRLF